MPAGTQAAIDLETEGVEWTDLTRRVQCIAVATDAEVLVIDYLPLDNAAKRQVLTWLAGLQLTAWNMMFDAAWLQRETRRLHTPPLTWMGCSLVLYKLFTTETPNFKWGLDSAQELILGWSGDSQKAWKREALARHKLRRDDQYQLYDLERVGWMEYCGADADGNWRIWQHMQAVARRDCPQLLAWLQVFTNEIWLLIEQQARGIALDVSRLQAYHADLKARIVQAEWDFRTHPQVAEYARTLLEAAQAAHAAAEPPKHTKTGAVAKRWETWNAKAGQTTVANVLNLNSGKQLQDLFYNHMGLPPLRTTANGTPQIDKKILPNLGEPGKLLATYRKLLKEEQYILAALASAVNGVVHPKFKIHGTVTGRVAGGS